MDRKELLSVEAVILRNDFKGIPVNTVGAVKKLTKTGVFIEWELPGNPVKHVRSEELGCIERYWRIKPVPETEDDLPW